MAVTLLVLSVGFYLFTQGSHSSFFGISLDKKTSPYTAAVYGLLFLIPLSIYVYSFSIQIVRLTNDKGWYQKLPPVFETNLPSENTFRRRNQKFSTVLFLALPMITLVHCFSKSLDATIYVNENCNAKSGCSKEYSKGPVENLTMFTDFSEIFTNGNGYRYDQQITYFPGWQPYLTLILLFIVMYVWIKLLTLVIGSRRFYLLLNLKKK
ncbi:hypothetical protein [Pleionea sediminis]|uniref:hypothetical protein n=1 Tax=Pleionea sediminis TaxID=2569479 RepID=UPI001184AD23|nr:hypothetical protein [Pleionea sediminis]